MPWAEFSVYVYHDTCGYRQTARKSICVNAEMRVLKALHFVDMKCGWLSIRVVVCSINKKVNVKLSLCLTKHHAMKSYWSGGIAPLIL